MNKKVSYGGWGIAILAVVFACLFGVSILSSPARVASEYENLYTEYSNIANSYNDLRNQYESTINSCESSLEQCPSILSGAKSTLPSDPISIIEKANISIWQQYSSIVFLLVLGSLALVAMSIQAYQFKRSSDQREKQFEREKQREKQQALEEGRRETIKSLALELVSDKDVISELTVWLNEYKSGEAEIDQSAYLHNQILTRLVRQIHLNPIAKINEIVTFNPEQHRTFDRLKPSDEAIVIEPGWRVGREIIKLPLVRRK